MKRLLLLSMALLTLMLTGCNSAPLPSDSDTSDPATPTGGSAAKTVRVLYSSKDTLDPYTCVTDQNAVLCHLIFEPLLVLDHAYEVEYRLAESVTVTDDICTITLRDADFSDGSPVTAADVIFSFEKAKKSNTRYAEALQYASKATKTGERSLTISLRRRDAYFANLLTFPILKSGSDELKDQDNQSLCPIGAGRYVFDNENDVLTLNKRYYGKKSSVQTVQTVDAPDAESVEQAVKAGMVDYYYTDLSNNIIPKMNGIAADVAQTRMVFLGINPSQPQLSNSLFRQALSAALDRKTICNSAYYSKAEPALGPFPSDWEPAKGYMNIQNTANPQTAASNIELAGFTKKNKEGYYLLKNGKPITFSLLVNSDNAARVTAAEQIVKNAKAAGIKISLNAVTQKQYFALLKSKQYDLYLGEVRMEENMDLGGLVSLHSAAQLLTNSDSSKSEKEATASKETATSPSSKPETSSDMGSGSDVAASSSDLQPGEITLTAAEAYRGYYGGDYSLQDLITAFTAELPVIPVCFRNGLVIYSDRFGSGITPTRSDLFHGIQLLK